MSADIDLTELINQITRGVQSALTMIGWAKDEIAQATRRHPEQSDILYHAITILNPREFPSMPTETVYRSHARELLERIINGADTRPGTTAEVRAVCSEITRRFPPSSTMAGLYGRCMLRIFGDNPALTEVAAIQAHYEELYGEEIDKMEQDFRAQVGDAQRKITDIACTGKHYGEETRCRYAAQPTSNGPQGPEPAPDRERRP